MALQGSRTTSDYIEWHKLESLYQYLFKHRQYKLSLFVCLGMFTGLRAGDILLLKWSDILKDHIELFERKTKKYRRIKINPALKTHINKVHQRLKETPLKSIRVRNEEEFVFSNKFRNVIVIF